jgi:hypothetical protein
VSLLLCVATLSAWARSYFRVARVSYNENDAGTYRLWYAASVFGRIEYYAGSTPGFRPGEIIVAVSGWSCSARPVRHVIKSDRPSYFLKPDGQFASGFFLGFGFAKAVMKAGGTQRALWLPHWSLVLLFAILPALRLRAAIRSRELRRVGLCPKCGYDLRATPDRCPECGAAPAAVR